MNNRKDKYFKLNTKLNYMTDNDLEFLIDNAINKTQRVGNNASVNIEVNEVKIFTKIIPMTQLEFDSQFSNKNLFDLPTYFNYNLGSVGINCWRELEMNIKTTNWVLNDVIENFPLMYHWRILKQNSRSIKFVDKIPQKEIEENTKYWNDNENIEKYLVARNEAPYYLILCIEYFPENMWSWLTDDPDRIKIYFNEITETIHFLMKNNIIHFDVHGGNVLTDGKNVYLTDFGTALDKGFDLSTAEKIFFEKNKYYDYGLAYATMGDFLRRKIFRPNNPDLFDWLKKELNIDGDIFDILNMLNLIIEKLSNNPNKLNDISKKLKTNDKYLEILLKLKNIILLHNKWMYKMYHDNTKQITFPNKEIIFEIKKISNDPIKGGNEFYFKEITDKDEVQKIVPNLKPGIFEALHGTIYYFYYSGNELIGEVFLQKPNNEPIHIASGESMNGRTYVWGVGIKESYQGQGLGYKMLNKILDPKIPYFLKVRKDNVKAIGLYEKLGFKFYKEAYLNKDQNIMIRD